MFFGNFSGRGCLYSLLIAIGIGLVSLLIGRMLGFSFFFFFPFIFLPFMFKRK